MRLHRFDDFPFHQGLFTLDIPDTSDTHYNDGYWFGFFAPGSYVFTGLRLHPNNNVMDGYAGIVRDGEQRNIRVSRALRPRADELVVGPLSVEILEPMRRQRVLLHDNESGLSFDVVFESVGPAFAEAPHVQRRFGKLMNHVLRYTQVCRATGQITVDGQTTAVERWHAARDHSWGLRASMGPYTPIRGVEPDAADRDPRALRLWVPLDAEGQGHIGFFHLHEDADGRLLDSEGRIDLPDGTEIAVDSVRHELEYFPGSRRLRAGRFVL